MRKYKLLSAIVAAFSIAIIGSSTVYAGNVGVDISRRGQSRYHATGAGADLDNSAVTYSVNGIQAYCIQAGIAIHSSRTYEAKGELYDARFSWIIYNVADQDLRQAAIWELAGMVGYRSRVTDKDQSVDDIINQATAVVSNQGGGSAGLSFDGGEVYLDTKLRAVVTPLIHISSASGTSISGATAGTYFVREDGSYAGTSVGDGNYRLAIPANEATHAMDVKIHVNGGGTVQTYGAATIWGDTQKQADWQLVVTPNMSTAVTSDTEGTTTINPLGNLVVVKKDNYGKNKANATFHVTGMGGTWNITTDENGVARLDNILIGEYTITETQAPENMLNEENGRSVKVTVRSGQTTTYTRTNAYQRGNAKLTKYDSVNREKTLGDAKLQGAVYELHAAETIKEGETQVYAENQLVTTVTTKEDGITNDVQNLPIGKYYYVETKASEGFNLNTEKFPVEITYAGQYQSKANIGITEASETPIFGRVAVMKYENKPDSTDNYPAKGAILRLTLNSNPNQYYDAVVNEDGYAEFICDTVKWFSPDYTIPYGEYTISEIKSGDNGEHSFFYIQKEVISIVNEHDFQKRIEADEPTAAWLRLIKIDKDTNTVSELEGAKFKIWNVEEKDWVKQMITPSGKIIDEFTTADSGTLTTPEKVQPGKYVIYETQAPEGYYLQDNLRLPENDTDIGNTDVSGQGVIIDKLATGLTEDASYPEGGVKTGSLVVDVKLADEPLKVKLTIEKKGEVLTQTKSETVSYKTGENTTEQVEKVTPIYKMKGLRDVEYTMYAAEDIKTPDGKLRYNKDEAVSVFTTNEEGLGTSDELYPGKYRIVETKTPNGYITDENIPNVTLENKDQYVRVAESKKELTNVRQKLQITFKKIFEETKYSISKDVAKEAIFGVYTKDAIKFENGNIAIPSDTLVDLVSADENNDVTSKIDLPEGTYYVKELYTSFPYVISEEVVEYTLKYNENSKQEFVTFQGPDYENTTDGKDVTLIKLSSSQLGSVIVTGDNMEILGKDETIAQLLETFKGQTIYKVKELMKENNLHGLEGAEYTLYLDKECTKQIYLDGEVATLVSNGEGIIELSNLPAGVYFIKETKAPKNYNISDEVIELNLSVEEENGTIYKVLDDTIVMSAFITKKDIFTSEYIPNCTFEIKDKETGKVLLRSITDKNGEAKIPTDLFENGKTYTYTEIEAPEMYKLNEEEHEFVAEFDDNGEWITEPIVVYNLRNTTDVKIEKTDFITGDRIPNCTFELKSLETDFKVEGTTDENGEYYFYDIPYGKYTYTEISAPEEYNLDTTPHEFTISGEMVVLQITNEKKPDAPETGDIAVMALSAMAMVSVLGIAFVIVKNRKQLQK